MSTLNDFKFEALNTGSFSGQKSVDTNETNKNDIAVIGMSVKLSGAQSTEEFWEMLANGDDRISDISMSRKQDIEDYLLFQGIDPNSITYEKGAFLPEIDKFDYKFFRMTPKEAVLMNPSQRMFLEKAWEALEDAGYANSRGRGGKVGVFVGYISDYDGYKYKEWAMGMNGFNIIGIPGNLSSMIPSRISYLLDLKGPAMLVDTACSSSLISVHLACESIKRGECDMALAGGVRISILPVKNEEKIGIESSDGKTKAFDDSSDGTGLGEGIGIVVLKPLKQALSDHDHIYGVIKGSSANQDGTSAGITAPNALAQRDLLIDAWNNAEINPEDLGFIEAHGTGTKLGDPIEIDALQKAFAKYTDKKQFCGIGSVKTNIGHLFDTAGIIGLIKVLLCMEKKKITSSLHFHKQNREIEFERSPLYLNNRLTDWKSLKPMLAGISSFGFSGTNCHIVVQENSITEQLVTIKKRPEVLLISAKSLNALKKIINKYTYFICRNENLSFENLCYTSVVAREHYSHRVAVVADSIEQLKDKMISLADDYNSISGFHGVYRSDYTDELNLSSEGKSGNDDSPEEMAKKYALGQVVNWDTYYGGRGYQTISLPGYPFEKLRCWVDAPKVNLSDIKGLQKNKVSSIEYRNEEVKLSGKADSQSYSSEEKWLAQIIGNTLGYKEISVNESFYGMGCDSISMFKIVNQMKKEKDLPLLTIEQLFTYDTIEKLAKIIKGYQNETTASGPEFKKIKDMDFYPVTPSQRRMYMFQAMDNDSCIYNVNGAFEIIGEIDKNLLRDAFCSLIKRHESLRTIFFTQKGEIYQKILDPENIIMQIEEVFLQSEENIDEKINSLISPFKLDQGPLFRVFLIRKQPDKTYLMLDLHHIICDVSALTIFAHELGQLYMGITLKDLEFQYRDYVYWLKEKHQSEDMMRQKEFWVNQFETLPEQIKLPVDYDRNNTSDSKGETIFFKLNKSSKEGIERLANESHTTMYMILLASLSVLFFHESGQDDMVIGSPIACRNNQELEKIIGVTVNTVAIRLNPEANLTFSEYLANVKEKIIKIFENPDYPFDELVSQLRSRPDSLSNSLVDVIFSLQGVPSFQINNLEFKEYRYKKHLAMFDISIVANMRSDYIDIELVYRDQLFKKNSVKALVEKYCMIIETVISTPDILLKDIQAYSNAEIEMFNKKSHDVQELTNDFDF